MPGRRYLGMAAGDLEGKPYAQYWEPDMAPLRRHVQRALELCPEASELGFDLEEADRLLEPGHLPLETGFTRLASGQVFVAVLTYMPGVRPEMIDWWFGWHPMESQRYKLWHPRAHVACRAERMVGDDPTLTDREKYLRNPNHVTEYIGGELLDITITFEEPSEVLDVSRFQAAGVGTAICGRVGLRGLPLEVGRLIHLVRETEDGCEMRSRFWLGRLGLGRRGEGQLLDPVLRSRFVARRAFGLAQARDMVVHCASEMNHLAGFLPALYADYHPGR